MDACDQVSTSVYGLGRVEHWNGDDEIADSDLCARVSLTIVAPDRETLMTRLTRLCDKLGVDRPLPFEVGKRSCAYCKAKPNEPCRTKSGTLAKDWHADRKRPAGYSCEEMVRPVFFPEDYYTEDPDEYHY